MNEDWPRRRSAATRVDKRGRAAGRARNKNPKSGPSECGVEHWVWLPVELLESLAWSALSVNGRKLIDRILLEHAHQGGVQNGALVVPHKDLEIYGLSKNLIRRAIEEAETLGLIRVERGRSLGARRPPNLFRLTWIGGWKRRDEIIPPSNEWKAVDQKAIDAFTARRRVAMKAGR